MSEFLFPVLRPFLFIKSLILFSDWLKPSFEFWVCRCEFKFLISFILTVGLWIFLPENIYLVLKILLLNGFSPCSFYKISPSIHFIWSYFFIISLILRSFKFILLVLRALLITLLVTIPKFLTSFGEIKLLFIFELI